MADQMQKRMQDLIDKRPTEPRDSAGIDVWVAEINGVLEFHPKGKAFKKDIETIRTDEPGCEMTEGDPSSLRYYGEDTRIEQIVKKLEVLRDLS